MGMIKKLCYFVCKFLLNNKELRYLKNIQFNNYLLKNIGLIDKLLEQ